MEFKPPVKKQNSWGQIKNNGIVRIEAELQGMQTVDADMVTRRFANIRDIASETHEQLLYNLPEQPTAIPYKPGDVWLD